MLEQRRLLIYHLAFMLILATVVMGAALLVLFLLFKGSNIEPQLRPQFDEPFFLAGLIAWGLGLLIMVIGTGGILRASRPIFSRLDQSEERNRELLEATTDGVVDYDEDGRIIALNPAAERAFGRSTSSVVGRPISVLLPELRTPADSETDGKPASSRRGGIAGPCRGVQTNGVRDGGASFPVELSVVEQGSDQRSYVAVVRDLSETLIAQKALAESEERFRILSRASLEGIAIVENGKILDFNQTLSQMVGRSGDNLSGEPILNCFTPEAHSAVQEVLSDPRDQVAEVKARRADGGNFDCEIAVKSMPYRGRQVEVMALRDVSVRKQVEGVMQQYQRSEADLAIIQKTAATYAHEINNPLTGVLGMLEMLIEEESDSERGEMLQDALMCSRRIKDVISKLGQISAPKYRPYLDHAEMIDIHNPDVLAPAADRPA